MPSYSTMDKLKLLKGYQDSEASLKVYADTHAVYDQTLKRWIKQFLLYDLAGIRQRKSNHRYSFKTKINAVKDYQAGLSRAQVLEKYDIRSFSQLNQWTIQYNKDELKPSRKRVRNMGRKVDFEEKKQIVQWVLDHGRNYQAAAKKFDVSYQRVYAWVRKYLQAGDWDALIDNRGKRKAPIAPAEMTELERLKAENEALRQKNHRMELEIAFAKKLNEIRNRGVKRPNYIKRFKN